jgi:invasion protein IalB
VSHAKLVIAGAALIALAGAAQAQDRADAAWRVECGGDGKTLDCRAVQQASQAQGQPLLAAMAVRVPADTKKPAMTLQLPLGIQLGEPVTFRVDEGATEKLTLQTCNQAGCFVVSALADASVNAMRNGRQLHIGFRDANKQAVTATIPLLGFGLALDKAK